MGRRRPAYHRRMRDLDPRTLRALVHAMPKAELHLHLDGSLRIDTALDIALTRGVDAPRTFASMRDALVAPDQVTDQAELLRAFDLPIVLLQDADALARVAGDLVEAKACDRVRYAEIRWAPLLHTDRGLTGRQAVEAVARGAFATARRCGIEVRLIATLLRSHDPTVNLAFIRSLEANGVPDGLVGVDLAGREARFPDPALHRAAIELARAIGPSTSRCTPASGRRRAGPARPRAGPGADRPRAARDRRPGSRPELVARGTWLDLCPTSNIQARIVATIADHPLARLLRAGVRVTLSTDDLTVSDVTLSDEYERAVGQVGRDAAAGAVVD